MSGRILRPLQDADRPALLEIWVAAWTLVLPQIDFAGRSVWFAGHWRMLEAGGAATMVGLVADSPQGFVIFHPASGYIDQICVSPETQGNGLSVLLLGAAKAHCPDGLTLKVNQDNPRAVGFYQREGFVVTGKGVSEASGLKLWEMAWRG